MAEDMAGLGPSHRIAKFAVFDQFPYTPHAECGALLLATGLGPGAGAGGGGGGGSAAAPKPMAAAGPDAGGSAEPSSAKGIIGFVSGSAMM